MKKNIGAKTVVFPTPTFIVGTYGADGKANVMNAAWGGISSSEPPCVTVSLREERQTSSNIMEKKAFTVCIPSEQYVKEADLFGITSGKEVDKFQVAGLTAAKSPDVDAPYVEEFPLVLECRLLAHFKVGSHIQFAGEIVGVLADENCLDAEGEPDIEKVMPVMYNPANNTYHGAGKTLATAFSAGVPLISKKK